MSITYTKTSAPLKVTANFDEVPEQLKPQRSNGHQQPKALMVPLDTPGARVRVCHWLHLLGGLSASAFYKRLERGYIPLPDGHDPRPYWRTETVQEFLSK